MVVSLKFDIFEPVFMIKIDSMKLLRYICFLICLLFVSPQVMQSQMLLSQRNNDIESNTLYNESVYILSNYSSLLTAPKETMSLEELLEQNVEGFYFFLRKDSVSNSLMLRQPDGTFTSFSESLQIIKNALTSDSRRIVTLFLDYVVDSDMHQIFSEVGLMNYVLEYDTRTGWPSLKNMIESNKRLVLFEVQHHLNSPAWLHSMDEYVEHTDNDWGNNTGVVESFDERLKKSLSLFTDLKYLEIIRGEDEMTVMARQTPYIIEAYKRAWIRDGMMPNFVLVNKYYRWLTGTLMTFRGFCIASGLVTYNGELMNYVNWTGLSNSTPGKFTFPLEQGAENQFTPTSPGFLLEPSKSSVVQGSGKRVFVGEFKARPLPISENLEMYLPLNGDALDVSKNRKNTLNRGVEFGMDPVRGEVGSFENGARVELPVSSDMKIRDHDFTVGVWLMIPKYLEGKSDYCVLGSKNNSYQQTLHFLIRNRKPYMGFYNNDLVGNTEIEPGKWYHVVWRYNKSNAEQAIFVNGKLDAISVDRPPYLGNDSLYVGHVDLSEDADFSGNLSGLGIWSRVLGDKEVLALNNQLADFRDSSMPTWAYVIIGIGVVAILGIVSLFLHYIYRRKKHGLQDTDLSPLRREQPQELPEQKKTNFIQLFGEFTVVDKDGQNITSLFTPKIKQLFLIILLHSSRGEQGVLSSEMTEMIWGLDSGKNIKSLRSVSILKLRKILERLDKAEIIFGSNRYMLVISNGLTCDYLQFLALLKENKIQTRRDFEYYYKLIGGGEAFEGDSYDWMDDYKGYVSNSAVDLMSKFIGEYSLKTDADKIIQIADQMLVNDPSNEEAIAYKVRALIAHGNYKQARYAYDRFCHLYNEMYGEPFKPTFEQLASSASAE